MLHYIERLQKKPEYARKRIAFVWTSGVTLVVLAMWLSTLGTRWGNTDENQEAEGENSPFALIREEFGTLLQSAKGRFEYSKKDGSEVASSSPDAVKESKGEGANQDFVIEVENIETESEVKNTGEDSIEGNE